MREKEVSLNVNGKIRKIFVRSNETLLNSIREKLGMTGTKYGCGTGECGACTVLVDGEPVLSCIVLTISVDGRKITTIEGLADKELNPIMKAFLDFGAVQCGYCTPGLILMAKALLDENPNPTREEIKMHIKGNLCRCTGYTNIIKAIESLRKDVF